MTTPPDRFAALGIDFAPGQSENETGSIDDMQLGDRIPGEPVDFSHGDVDAFPPAPGAFEAFRAGVEEGGSQAYTEYRGRGVIREAVAGRLSDFTGAPVHPDHELIITPGSQGALFLAMGACINTGDRVAIIEPDYFANRKLVHFFGGVPLPVQLHYSRPATAELDLGALEKVFHAGARTLVLSNPNNPTGAVYTSAQIHLIAQLANQYDATVIADQLYSRLQYGGTEYTHLRAAGIREENCVTLMGPSKTESLSGYRLGVAFGAPDLIARMEKIQAIASLRAPGYSQAVLDTWFEEPDGWMEDRTARHQAIRDDIVRLFRDAPGFEVRVPDAGSYIFPRLPGLRVSPTDFVRLLRAQADVIVTPGSEFSPHHDHSIRLNYSQDHQAALDAVARLITLASRYA